MTAERWQQVETLYHAALGREASERVAFLAVACRGDDELHREVESLLAQDPSGSHLLDNPAWEGAASLLGAAGGSPAGASPSGTSNDSRGDRPSGQIISHYEILDKLGGGGMGVVYRARDLKLDRSVALKFLSHEISAEEDYKQRFVREAKAASALDHPNICTIHEVDETADGQMFIAMAYYPGETLKKKIKRGPLPLAEAIDLAMQVARGLAKAHQRGIAHRDIKPANILVTEEGVAKIVDFGLAQLGDATKLTKTGSTLGTPAYMSPEQAQRLPGDHRSDIWSLGVLLYEMVTGRAPFEGKHEAVLLAIMHEAHEPITAVRAGVPLELDRITGKALAKKPDERYQHVDEMAVDLKNLQRTVGTRHAVPAGTEASMTDRAQHSPPVRPQWQRYLPWAVAAVMALAFVSVAFVFFRQSPPPELPVRRFAYMPSAAMLDRRFYRWSPNLAISPDGKHIAFTTGTPWNINGQLWVQDLDQPQPRLVVDGGGAGAPFWSPDSNHIGFTTVGIGAGELRRVPVQGGPSSRICASPGAFWGGTWSADGEVIVFGASNEADAFSMAGGGGLDLYEVPASGGAAKPVLLPETSEEPAGRREERPYWPHFLPREAGPRVLVYANARFRSAAEHTLMVHDLTTGRRAELGPGAFPVYAPSGHLVFQSRLNNCDLMAAPFSLKSLQFTGERFPIREYACYPSVARDGTLVYLESSAPGMMKQMVWRDRRGAKLGTIGEPQLDLGMPELSPDGRRVLVQSNETGGQDVWVHDVARGVKQRLTFDPTADSRPIWLPKGDRFSFTSNRRGYHQWDIYVQSADETGEAQLLVGSPAVEFIYDWSADEKYATFNQAHQQMDLYYLKRRDDGSGYDSVLFLADPFDTFSPKLSPNSKFLAYESNESGRYEVYVQPFPQGGRKSLVSSNGGGQPRWRGDGRELFYVEGNTLMAVPVTTADGFSVGEPQRLFEAAPGALQNRGQVYAVTADGQRFIIVEDAEGEQAIIPTIQVTQNWFAEFKDRQQK